MDAKNDERTAPARSTAPSGEVVAWFAVAVVVQLFLGLGVVVGLVLAFTRLRYNESWARWIPTLLAAAVLVAQVLGLGVGVTEFELGPSTPVE